MFWMKKRGKVWQTWMFWKYVRDQPPNNCKSEKVLNLFHENLEDIFRNLPFKVVLARTLSLKLMEIANLSPCKYSRAAHPGPFKFRIGILKSRQQLQILSAHVQNLFELSGLDCRLWNNFLERLKPARFMHFL